MSRSRDNIFASLTLVFTRHPREKHCATNCCHLPRVPYTLFLSHITRFQANPATGLLYSDMSETPTDSTPPPTGPSRGRRKFFKYTRPPSSAAADSLSTGTPPPPPENGLTPPNPPPGGVGSESGTCLAALPSLLRH